MHLELYGGIMQIQESLILSRLHAHRDINRKVLCSRVAVRRLQYDVFKRLAMLRNDI